MPELMPVRSTLPEPLPNDFGMFLLQAEDVVNALSGTIDLIPTGQPHRDALIIEVNRLAHTLKSTRACCEMTPPNPNPGALLNVAQQSCADLDVGEMHEPFADGSGHNNGAYT